MIEFGRRVDVQSPRGGLSHARELVMTTDELRAPRARRRAAALSIVAAIIVATASGLVTAAMTRGVADAAALAPVGANDFDCHPPAEHPRPLLLLHGTTGNQRDWDSLAPKLSLEGYCVFTMNYGKSSASIAGIVGGWYGTGPVDDSGAEVGELVDRILNAEGVPQLDIVGFSQGGVVARDYLRFHGGVDRSNPVQNKVHTVITLGAPNHGTTANGLASLLKHRWLVGGAASVVSEAVTDQLADSSFISNLNAPGDTDPGVTYAVIATKYDTVSTPPEATFLNAGPGAVVYNMFVQDACSTDRADHSALPDDPVVARLVHYALTTSMEEALAPDRMCEDIT